MIAFGATKHLLRLNPLARRFLPLPGLASLRESVRDVDICLRQSPLTTTAQRATQFIHNERRIRICVSSASPSHERRLKQFDWEAGISEILISQPLTRPHTTVAALRREAA